MDEISPEIIDDCPTPELDEIYNVHYVDVSVSNNPSLLETSIQPIGASARESVICLEGNLVNESPSLQVNSHTNESATNNSDNDEDFCIVYEKIVPPPDIQIVHTNPHYIPNRNVIEIQDTTESVDSSAETKNKKPDEENLDDSVAIVAEIVSPFACIVEPKSNKSKVIRNTVIVRQNAVPSGEEKRRRIQCTVCFDSTDEISQKGGHLVSTTCGHIFCNDCMKQVIKATKKCPQCRKRLTTKQYHPLYI